VSAEHSPDVTTEAAGTPAVDTTAADTTTADTTTADTTTTAFTAVGTEAGDPAAAPVGDVDASPSHRGRRSRLPLLVAALAALLIATLVLALLVLLDVRHRDARERARSAAVAAAVLAIPRIGSYSYQSFAGDMAAARAVLTPAYAASYDRLVGPQQRLVDQQKAVVRSTVRQAQAISVDSETQVKVLVFFDQQTTSARLAAPAEKPNAFVAVMQRQGDGRWLVANLDSAVTASPGSGESAPAPSAPATSAPATSAPATSAPATSAPATSAPATSAPATSAPATSAPTPSATGS